MLAINLIKQFALSLKTQGLKYTKNNTNLVLKIFNHAVLCLISDYPNR